MVNANASESRANIVATVWFVTIFEIVSCPNGWTPINGCICFEFCECQKFTSVRAVKRRNVLSLLMKVHTCVGDIVPVACLQQNGHCSSVIHIKGKYGHTRHHYCVPSFKM